MDDVRNDVEAAFRNALGEVMDEVPDVLPEDADLRDELELTSLDIAELMLGVENELGLELPDEEFARLRSVGDFLRRLGTAVEAKEQATA